MKIHPPLAALLSLVAFVFAGCNSASVERTWKDPSVQKLEFKKILVLAPSTDGANRRIVEDTVVKTLPAGSAIPGYTVLADADSSRQLALVREAAKRSDVDGIVVLRLVANREELSYTPGVAYPVPYVTLGGYWNYGPRPFALAAPIPTSDRIVVIETNIYDARTEKLVWSGTTESFNPGSLEKLVTDASHAVLAELRKQKLIPEKK